MAFHPTLPATAQTALTEVGNYVDTREAAVRTYVDASIAEIPPATGGGSGGGGRVIVTEAEAFPLDPAAQPEGTLWVKVI